MTSSTVAARPVPWIVGGSVAACLAALAATGFDTVPEIVLGMAGPLVSAVGTCVLRERTAPERLGAVMMTAFAVKMLFFGAYVVAMLSVLNLEPRAFIVSFTCYYVALHLVEALLLKRQLAGTSPALVSAAIAGDGVRQER
jgi:hypothetical protein